MAYYAIALYMASSAIARHRKRPLTETVGLGNIVPMHELHRAAKRRDVARLRELLSTEAGKSEINVFDSDGRTPLMHAVRAGRIESVRHLLAAGASIHQKSKGTYESGSPVLSLAVGAGNPDIVATLIEAGADVHYSRDGYDVLTDAVHGRAVFRDPRLLKLLTLLVARGARTDTITKHSESVLRVLSRIGRFDAVKLLLDAGADESQLSWTPLIRAVALDSLADVEKGGLPRCLARRAGLLAATAWLVAIQTGDIEKAKLLWTAEQSVARWAVVHNPRFFTRFKASASLCYLGY